MPFSGERRSKNVINLEESHPEPAPAGGVSPIVVDEAPQQTGHETAASTSDSILPPELEERRKAAYKPATNAAEATKHRAQDVHILQQDAKESFMQQKRSGAEDPIADFAYMQQQRAEAEDPISDFAEMRLLPCRRTI